MLLEAAASAVSGCATERAGVAGQGTDEVDVAAAPGALIQMRRSGCVGEPCPVYSVAIYLDGTVVYDGRANVGHLGERRWKMPAESINRLLREIDAIDFLDTPERSGICPGATDTAIVIIDYRPGATQKTVIHDDRCGAAPPALAALEKAIDGVTGTARLIARPASAVRQR